MGLTLRSASSKATSMYAFKGSMPLVLKIYDLDDASRRELENSELLVEGGGKSHNLVAIPLQFKSEPKPGAFRLSAPTSRIVIGMPIYAVSVDKYPVPMSPVVALHMGICAKKALAHMHSLNLCHNDVKPSNIFIDMVRCFSAMCHVRHSSLLLQGGQFHLGDFGAVRKIGQPIEECTEQFMPLDAGLNSSVATDLLLLATTILDRVRSLFPVFPRSSLPQSAFHSFQIGSVVVTTPQQLL
jgi:serine/threonine protein kinase